MNFKQFINESRVTRLEFPKVLFNKDDVRGERKLVDFSNAWRIKDGGNKWVMFLDEDLFRKHYVGNGRGWDVMRRE